MEMMIEDIHKAYREFAEKNGYVIIELEKDHVHALLMTPTGRYALFEAREGGFISFIHSWGELPSARMAFRLFCHDTPEEVIKKWEKENR